MGCTCADLRYSVSWAYIFGRAKLMDAALDGNLDEVKRLLDAGVKIDTEYEAGNTPLIYASIPGHLDVAMLLLERGADINKRTTYGYTVLHMAARFGRLDVVKMLVESGADLHAKIYDWETIPWERRGKTPLGWARMNMYKDHEYDNEHKEEIQPQVIAFLEAAMQAHGDSSSVSQQAGEARTEYGSPSMRFSAAHEGKYLGGYAADRGKKHATLEEAQAACLADPSAGGVTKEREDAYTVRKGAELQDSPSGETSWIRKERERESI